MPAGGSDVPLTALRDLVNRWIGVETKRLERGAALRDVLALARMRAYTAAAARRGGKWRGWASD